MEQITGAFAWMLFPVIVFILFIVCGLIVLLIDRTVGTGVITDQIKNPQEYTDNGKTGERIIYLTLEKLGIPENQIFRNVYIPISDNRTAEIDLIIVSKKGLFVIECKNYAGNIYGDMNRKKWIQYVGSKKSYFYNPFLQNLGHVKALKNYFKDFGEMPIIPMISTIDRGNWKVRNLKDSDYLLGYNSHLKDIYSAIPDSSIMAEHWNKITLMLSERSRPGEEIAQKHIENVSSIR